MWLRCRPGGGDGAEPHDLLAAGRGRRRQLAAGGGGGGDEGTRKAPLKPGGLGCVRKRIPNGCVLRAGVPEGGGGERDRAGPAEGHPLREGGDWSRGVPLLLGHGVPQRLGK